MFKVPLAVPNKYSEVPSMRFCIYLAEEGLLNERQTLQIIRAMLRDTPQLGRIVLREKWLTLAQLRDLLARQAEQPKPLGQLAIEAGYLTESQVAHALAIQGREAPKSTDLIVRYGFLDEELVRKAHRAFTASS